MTGPSPGGREPGDREPGGTGAAGPPRVPRQREAPDPVGEAVTETNAETNADQGREAEPADAAPPGGDAAPCRSHQELMALLGAWALAACSPEEAECVEAHLNDCAACADEAMRLRDAATLLEPQRSLDLDARLRSRVLEGCLTRRPAQDGTGCWAEPYDAEAARLDALLNDITTEEWRTPVTLRWYAGGAWAQRSTTVGGVLDHLLAVDGLLARTVGLPDPLGGTGGDGGPMERTLARWAQERPGREEGKESEAEAWAPWREQSRALVRAAARTGGRVGERTVSRVRYGDLGLFPGEDGEGELALSDAYLGRAFACWVHADDIAQAVDYPYEPPLAAHLRLLVDLTARRLPGSIAGRRRAGLANLAGRLTTAGKPGRTLHLEVEGAGGGDFYISLDSPTATVSRRAARQAVAHVALDDVLFCQLASGRITPEEAAEGAGMEGDRNAVHDVLFAAADLSRL
jgi:hypothetical protein